MIPQDELNAEEIRETMQAVCQEGLPIEADGYVVSDTMIYDVLMKAASEGISVDAACRELESSASGNTIRERLNEQLESEPQKIREYEASLNQALCARLPQQIREQRLEASIDEHDEGCYGKSEALRRFTVRSRAKRGTTHFLRIATAYVVYRQMRMTVAVTFVLPEDSTLDVVKRLYQQMQTLSLHIGLLMLDRGFCCGQVIRYLQEQKQPSILACTIRGKQGGTRALCRGRKSYRTAYTFTDGTTAQMAVVATFVPGTDGKKRRKWLLYVIINLDWKPKTIARRYRFRFGIESTYRILRRVRIKSSSRNAAFRFFSLGFALLLVNIWAYLRWFVARIPGPGPHRVDPIHFQFHAFVSLLRRAIEQLYGVSMSVPFISSLHNS